MRPTGPVAVLVVVADGPTELTRREDSLGGSTMDWCAPGVDLGEHTWDLVLLANSARTPDMVTWVAVALPWLPLVLLGVGLLRFGIRRRRVE